jgi:predicted  nucleic acid-binding Zn-ribbon protein|tara:strand:- start:756 stop:974 length:219 start_codon:yes stop_codon:yes gene_type:complete
MSDSNTKKYLEKSYEGYTQNLQMVTEYIKKTEDELENARKHQAEMQAYVDELQEMLGIDETATTEEPAPANA